jgi:hypothetical protein
MLECQRRVLKVYRVLILYMKLVPPTYSYIIIIYDIEKNLNNQQIVYY